MSIAFWGRIRLAPPLMWNWQCQTSCIVCLRKGEITESCLLSWLIQTSLYTAWALALCYFRQNNTLPSGFFLKKTFTTFKQYLAMCKAGDSHDNCRDCEEKRGKFSVWRTWAEVRVICVVPTLVLLQRALLTEAGGVKQLSRSISLFEIHLLLLVWTPPLWKR